MSKADEIDIMEYLNYEIPEESPSQKEEKWIRERAHRHDFNIGFSVRLCVIKRVTKRNAKGRLVMACEECGMESPFGFELHHEYYIKDGGRIHYSETYGKQGHQYGVEGAGDLLLLCAACHRNKHGK